MKHKNTLQKGGIRYIVFKDADSWYAVGLEFNIVESGDTPQEALILLFEAVQGYVESARKIKARPSILNQKIDAEYSQMWNNLERGTGEPAKLPIFTFGTLSLRKKQSLVAA